jgi:ATP/maltotriose-dependent transcriptional regulator MalT
MLEQAVAIDTERGDRHAAMTSLHSLGDVALQARDPRAAAAHYRAALGVCLEQGDERSLAYCLAGLASVAAIDGDPYTAGRLWTAAERTEARAGVRMLANERARYEHLISPMHGDPVFESGRDAVRVLTPEGVAREVLGSDEPASTTLRMPGTG